MSIIPLICIAAAPFCFIAGFWCAASLDLADARQLRAENDRLRMHNVALIDGAEADSQLTQEVA